MQLKPTTDVTKQRAAEANEGCQRAWVEIDRAALSENVHQLKQLLKPSTQLMAVVKADAYGHGATMVDETVLETGAAGLCVATLVWGVQLR